MNTQHRALLYSMSQWWKEDRWTVSRLELQWLEEKITKEHEREYHEKMKKCFKYRLSQNLPEKKPQGKEPVAYAH